MSHGFNSVKYISLVTIIKLGAQLVASTNRILSVSHAFGVLKALST